MKLNLFFIVMELLTLLAYPILFVYGKLRQFSKLKESSPVVKLLVTGSVARDRWPTGIMNVQKAGNHAYSNH
jgi:hypothetical protein